MVASTEMTSALEEEEEEEVVEVVAEESRCVIGLIVYVSAGLPFEM